MYSLTNDNGLQKMTRGNLFVQTNNKIRNFIIKNNCYIGTLFIQMTSGYSLINDTLRRKSSFLNEPGQQFKASCFRIHTIM